MATVKDIYCAMDEWAPFETQMDFDNAGFLVGRGEAKADKVLVALDITQEVVEEAAKLGCQVIVSHHPVIFHPVKAVTDESVTGRTLLALTEAKIAAICCHTNLDAAQDGVNDCLAQALGLQEVTQLHPDGVDRAGRTYGIGRVGMCHQPGMSAADYAGRVKLLLGAAGVRYTDGGRPVRRVAVGGGSCGDFEGAAIAAGCDTFVTSDLGYHQFLDAAGKGINLIDAGHFPTEDPVCSKLVDELSRAFPSLSIEKSASQDRKSVV